MKVASSEDVGKRKSLEEPPVVESEPVKQKPKVVEPEQPSAEINISENTGKYWFNNSGSNNLISCLPGSVVNALALVCCHQVG